MSLDAYMAFWDAHDPKVAWTMEDKETLKKLLAALPKEDRVRALLYPFQKDIEGIEPFFETSETSPNGEYLLSIYAYPFRMGSMGRIHRAKDGVLVAEVKRNFRFLGSWLGDRYFFTGEDYQGYTICDLHTGDKVTHVPEAALEGFGFCPVNASLLDTETLLIEGCYWGGPEEYRLLDFSKPMQVPLPEISQPFQMVADLGECFVKINEKGNPEFTAYDLFLKETGEPVLDVYNRVGYARANQMVKERSLWDAELKTRIEFPKK